MPRTTEEAVEAVIDTMRRNLSEQLTVDEMARTAMFSKFHFTRIFQRVTGISPGRFLSAIRLEEAKRLLITTSLNVADISMRVGYNSVGTFSTRFTKSVGLSPTTYRRLDGYASDIPVNLPSRPRNVLRGMVHPYREDGPAGAVFLGLFTQRIPEGAPVQCTILDRPGSFTFTEVPDGSYFLLCHSIAGEPLGVADGDVTVSTVGPIEFRGAMTATVHARLKPATRLDPPVLLALLDSRKAALKRLHEYESATAA